MQKPLKSKKPDKSKQKTKFRKAAPTQTKNKKGSQIVKHIKKEKVFATKEIGRKIETIIRDRADRVEERLKLKEVENAPKSKKAKKGEKKKTNKGPITPTASA